MFARKVYPNRRLIGSRYAFGKRRATSALSRHESRGLHYTLDYPDLLDEACDTVLVP